MQGQSTAITVEPRVVMRFLISIVVLLLIAHVVVAFVRFVLGYPYAFGFVPMFDLDEENNVPTWFSSFLLLFCSALVAIIAVFKNQQRAPYTSHWAALAMILFYLSVDEASSIHELLSLVTSRFIDARGLLYHSWVVPGAALVAVFAALFWKFAWNLPLKTRGLFAAAAVVFLTGALGIEVLGGWQNHAHGRDNVLYRLLALLEEGLEMGGMLLFAYALLDYISTNVHTLTIHFGNRCAGSDPDSEPSPENS